MQILTGFLLTVPFSSRFTTLSELQRISYLCTLLGSILATALLVAPAAFHRLLFHRRRRPWLVQAAHLCALAGLYVLATVCAGVVFLVFDIATSTPLAILVGCLTFGIFAVLWVGAPVAARIQRSRAQPPARSSRS